MLSIAQTFDSIRDCFYKYIYKSMQLCSSKDSKPDIDELISVSKTVCDENLTALNTVYYYLLIPPLKLVKAVTCLASSMLNSKIS